MEVAMVWELGGCQKEEHSVLHWQTRKPMKSNDANATTEWHKQIVFFRISFQSSCFCGT